MHCGEGNTYVGSLRYLLTTYLTLPMVKSWKTQRSLNWTTMSALDMPWRLDCTMKWICSCLYLPVPTIFAVGGWWLGKEGCGEFELRGWLIESWMEKKIGGLRREGDGGYE